MDQNADGGSFVVKICRDPCALATTAAKHAANRLRERIRDRRAVRILAATAASQFAFLEALTKEPGIDWGCVEVFQLDEYIGLPLAHPGSFRRMLLERLIRPARIANYHLLDTENDPSEVLRQAGAALTAAPIDIAFLGIGENGHLAFNDPPADFETEEPYLMVDLDEACRFQQVGEGWFASLADVPKRALSMSVRQILKAKEIIVVVPDSRKAKAVEACLEGEISPRSPASILRLHPNTTVYLDRDSSALLKRRSEIS